MRLLHVVPHIDREASGPGYSVPALCDALARRGDEVTLVTLAREPIAREYLFRHLSYPLSFGPERIGRSRAMRAGLIAAAGAMDVIHSHSLWMMPNIYPAEAAMKAGRPLVISPRGTLSPVALRRSHWRKRLLWWSGQHAAVAMASAYHATSEQEHRDIRAAGFRQPVAVIPNGVDLPPPARPRARRKRRRMLYLGRIHPIKGLDNLLRAWATVSARATDWDLHIVGPDSDGHEAALRRLATELRLESLEFSGPKYGPAKSDCYRDADLYVLPSHTENFAMSVAEALAHGLPVVTTRGTPWSALRDKGCGWWVNADTAGLTQALLAATAVSPGDLSAMGKRGRQWMADEFSWTYVAEEMAALYDWIARGGAPPANVRVA